MMYKTVEKVINENCYSIRAFTGSVGLGLLAEFVGYAAGILKLLSLENVSIQGVLDTHLDALALDKIVEYLQETLLIHENREKFLSFLMRLVANTIRNGKEELAQKTYFDIAFSMNYEDLFELIREILNVNFFSQPFMRKLFTKKT